MTKTSNSQLLLHFLEGVFSLLEESIDDALAEIAVFLVIIHLKDLFECALIEDLLVIRQLGRALLGLVSSVHEAQLKINQQHLPTRSSWYRLAP
jgi:hypothetical protein